MQHLKLTFEDISQKNILYYDKKVEEACFNICDSLKIDNMPDYDSASYFELMDGEFQKKEIDRNIRLNNQDRIFDESLLEKFGNNRHNVLFVFKGEVLNGIVHFSDYNQTRVLQAIQDDVLTFERRMRQFLFLKNYRNQDMINYFQYRAKKYSTSSNFYERKLDGLNRRKEEMNQLGEFQVFDLKDLLEFGNSSFSSKLFPTDKITIDKLNTHEIKLVNSLRNMAMHGKNPVGQDQETSVYSLKGLKRLFVSLETLTQLTRRIEKLISNHEDYLKSVILDNRSRLGIIHEHHPKALNYFIGY